MKQNAHNGTRVGDLAPDFTLPDQNGNLVHLADVVAKNAVVLYFYPKDDSAGCTVEACTFRDSYEAFQQAGATVIGVSADSVKSHESFAQKHHLPFLLLSDHDRIVHQLYGISNFLGLFPSRETFVIDQEGVIRHRFVSQVNMGKHITEALQALGTLQKAPAAHKSA